MYIYNLLGIFSIMRICHFLYFREEEIKAQNSNALSKSIYLRLGNTWNAYHIYRYSTCLFEK